MNILFVCSRNKWRSPTAEAIYKNRSDLNVRSAGTSPAAKVKLNQKLFFDQILSLLWKRNTSKK